METAIKERPILFSGPMVRAILSDKKTVTRRVVKPQPPDGWSPVVEHYCPVEISADGEEAPGPLCFGASDEEFGVRCPYGQPGDRLWVRETWSTTWDKDAFGCIAYKADGEVRHYICDYNGEGDPLGLGGPAGLVDPVRTWRPSIHMPRWASRITLEVKSVRVERLQEITEDECVAEGMDGDYWWAGAARCDKDADLVINQFERLWDQLNAGRGYGWESNPWVWRVEFERIQGD